MNIIYEYDNVAQSDRFEAMAKEKLMKLSNKFEMVIRADVFFKEENTSSDETGKICNIRLSLPGPRLFADSSKENFVMAIGESVDNLERQLRKHKEKLNQ
ncbi:ribosome hibernation-promoting factor, HPF/YfiA family [Flagellimonas crocea]|uniref:ribosome hibernation-promoting factor, HPF/YfiA family n=1 Tax=Flagellimonas crocea TaxID=3067311 RepID=UPI00296E98C6|nr:ribosome-associated translation inhibitor RaiA [Muricauda sp. DH64]